MSELSAFDERKSTESAVRVFVTALRKTEFIPFPSGDRGPHRMNGMNSVLRRDLPVLTRAAGRVTWRLSDAPTNVGSLAHDRSVCVAMEQQIHEQGLVSVLRQIHDDLDAAVFDAYGWPHDLSDEDILQRLVDLNRERAEEERRGLIRWLRPEFQNPQGGGHAAGSADRRSGRRGAARRATRPAQEALLSSLSCDHCMMLVHLCPGVAIRAILTLIRLVARMATPGHG